MSGRVTPKGGQEQTVSSLRQRNPAMWWVAVIVVVALVLTSLGGAFVAFVFN